MLCARAVPPEHPSQRTLRLPASCAMLCHGALGIVLTTPLSYAAVGFSWDQLGEAPVLRNTRNQFEVSLQGGFV